MKIRLLAVGKPRDAELIRLHDRYAERLRHFGLRYESVSVAEERAGGRFSDAHVRQREARRILDKLAGAACVTALDPGGRLLDSEGLAAGIERWATPDWTLVIGGPLGLDASVIERADWSWSVSPLTFAHEWMRPILVEQLYRALSIRRGTAYHK